MPPHHLHRNQPLRLALLLCAAAVANPARAQPATDTNPVELSPFEVVDKKPTRYQAAESTSGGRIRSDVFDSVQMVNVVTSELISDVSPNRLTDVLKYIPGVQQNIIPNAADYTSIRGFQVVNRNVDGFRTFAQSNMDPVTVDRIEVVKGPNAILSPEGSPGGTINTVSKKPLFTAQNSLRLETGLYAAGSVELDSTGTVPGTHDKVAYRLVGARRDYDWYYDNSSVKSYMIAPSLLFRVTPASQLILQAEFSQSKGSNYLGVPIDPLSAGPSQNARIIPGISDRLSLYNDDIYREERRREFRLLFTSQITGHLSTRVAARYQKQTQEYRQLNTGGNSFGARDPRTGQWTPGIVYGPAPTYTPSPAPAQTRVFTRSGTLFQGDLQYLNVQNDWVYQREVGPIKSTTGFGFSYDRQLPGNGDPGSTFYVITTPATNIDAVVLTPFVRGAMNARTSDRRYTRQFYANQQLGFLQDRVIVSAGVSDLKFSNTANNFLTNTTAITKSSINPYNYGIVAKPLANVSLYYGFSQNATPVASSMSPAGTPAFAVGRQREGGIRLRLMDSKLYASVAYFHIDQSAFSVANPANLAVPTPNPLLGALFTDRVAKGWEFELNYEVTPSLTMIGSYTDSTNRGPYDVQVNRGASDRSAAAWLRYEFKQGPLKGFSASLGANYLGRAPGDVITTFTAASTFDHVIPNQPSFWIAPRTLVDAALGYTTTRWTFQLNAENLLNKRYIASAVSNFHAFPGPGTNLRASVTYKF